MTCARSLSFSFHCEANFLKMLIHERFGGGNDVIACVGIGDVQSGRQQLRTDARTSARSGSPGRWKYSVLR